MPAAVPHFSLTDQAGKSHPLPGSRPALVCFVKEDCPTCGLTMPLIERAYRAFGARADVVAIGQDAPGNALMIARHELSVPMLDDSALGVSYSHDV